MTNIMDTKPQRIVIIGGSFAGCYLAQALEKLLKKTDTEILLIDRNNYFIFYPLLVEAGTGSLEPRHVVVPIREFLKTSSFRMAKVLNVDPVKQTVEYEHEDIGIKSELSYDHLVVAIGSVTRLPQVPGLKDYGFEMKTLTDAVLLRDRAIQQLELADALPDPAIKKALLHFVIVGGNFTGAEVAGEFHEFLQAASANYKNISIDDCKVTLIDRSKRLLDALDEQLSSYAQATFIKRGINIILNTSVQEIELNGVKLSDGQILPAYTVVWCAGIAPNPLLRSLPFPINEFGYLKCERNLRIESFKNIWAVGDCATILDESGKPYPATAQHAIMEAKHLAKNLKLVFQNLEPLPCNIKSQGTLAALGRYSGVAKIGPIRLSGFIAWFVWRTVYLFKMPKLSRKVRIALDWTLGLIFKHDFVGLGLHRRIRNQK